jgi:DnaK suppressor protein
MDQKRRKALREELLRKKREMLDIYTKNKTYGKEADEDGAQDIADKASSAYTKEFLFGLSSSEREQLQELDEAIVRLDEGRFGTCTACQGDVERKRLDAVPWAKYCRSCQEKLEQGLL